MEDLLSRIRDQEFRNFLVVTLRTGCRPQEVRVLEARYVLPKEGVARIPKELAKGKRKERLVPLDDVVLGILKPLMLKYPEGPLLRNLLIGVSPFAVIAWETNENRPNVQRQKAIIALRKTGKRQIMAMLKAGKSLLG